jgi:hypothetical protein
VVQEFLTLDDVVQEHFWGGLDTFAFSYFLEFYLPMVLFTSIYAVVRPLP